MFSRGTTLIVMHVQIFNTTLSLVMKGLNKKFTVLCSFQPPWSLRVKTCRVSFYSAKQTHFHHRYNGV